MLDISETISDIGRTWIGKVIIIILGVSNWIVKYIEIIQEKSRTAKATAGRKREKYWTD